MLTFLFSFMDILNTVKYILIFILVLGLIVGIHEAGHFFFARRANILCREYAIGMGPKLCGFRKGETFYNLRAFPIGGFCAIAGEELEEDPFKDLKEIKLKIEDNKITGFYLDADDDSIEYPKYTIASYDIFDEEQTGNLYMEVIEPDSSEDTLTTRFEVHPQAMLYHKKQAMQIAPYNRTLMSKNKRQRAMVMFGGPLANFVLAFVIFFIVGLFVRVPNTKSTKISEVSMDTNAYTVLQSGDKITEMKTATLDSSPIETWTDLQDFMQKYTEARVNEKIQITIERDGEAINVEVTPFIAINSLGIGSDFEYTESGITKIAVYQEMYQDKIVDNTLLKEGDIITRIQSFEYKDGIDNPTWTDVRKVLEDYTGDYDNKEDKYINITVKRLKSEESDEYEELTVKVLPYSDYVLKNQTSINGSEVAPVTVAIGISPETKFSFVNSITYPFVRTWGSFTAVLKTLKMLFSGAVSIKNLSGPIGIYSITKQASQYGVLYVLSLIGLLSVNIGFLNLLPIPALDGGRLVFVAYEAIFKKKPNQKVETVLITITFILLLGLMVFVGFEDIMRLINGR